MGRSNNDLGSQLESIKGKLKESERLLEVEKRRADGLDVEVVNLRQANKDAAAENETLKLEVQKGVEDIAGALGDGYNRCLQRIAGVGFDATGHSFEDYIRDFAASRPSDNQDLENGP